MNILDKIFGEPKADDQNYWRRNSGKKVAAKILMPTEQEIKSQEAQTAPNDNPDTR